MSLWAYHEKTGLAVEAYKLETDASWIDKKQDKFILPDSEIRNITEVKRKQIKPYCSFVKSHNRDEEYVQAHFRNSNEEVLTYSGENESEEHKLAKDEIYKKVSLKEITFNISGKIYAVSDLPKFCLRIEKEIGQRNRADVILIFDKEHDIIGNGICVEIQLSPQSDEKENYRNYTRAIEGYSCVWLKERDFSFGTLQNDELKIRSYRDILLEFEEKVRNDSGKRIAVYSESIDKKIKELKEIEEEIIFKQRILKEERENIFNNFNKEVLKKIDVERKEIEDESLRRINSLFRNQILELRQKSEEFKEGAKKSISENDIIIKKEFENHLNSLRQRQEQLLEKISLKIEQDIRERITDVVNKKVINFDNYISELVREKIKNNNNYILEKVRETINSELKEDINEKIEEELKKEIANKKNKITESLNFQIKSDIDLTKEKVLREYNNVAQEKIIILEKEINLILPELKKMAFEFLKNKIKEVVDETKGTKD